VRKVELYVSARPRFVQMFCLSRVRTSLYDTCMIEPNIAIQTYRSVIRTIITLLLSSLTRIRLRANANAIAYFDVLDL
jgi:hypothetical protein